MKISALPTKILQTRPNAQATMIAAKPMKATLYARLSPETITTETRCRAYYLDNVQWQMVELTLVELATFLPDLPLVLCLSPHHAPIVSIKLPASRRAQQRQVLPFALEESIADDIENIHFVMANKPLLNGLFLVSYVNKTEFANILKPFQTHKRRIQAIIPELFILPKTDEKTWLAWSDGAHTLVRQNEYEGFICQNEQLDTWLSTQKERMDNHAIQISLQGKPPSWLAASLRDAGIPVLPVPVPHHLGFVPPESPIYPLNLLESHLHHMDFARLQPWRWAIGLGILCFGLFCTHKLFENRQLNLEIDSLNQQNRMIVQSWFPSMQRIFDLETQVKSELKKLPKTHTNVLGLLADMAGVLPAGTQVTRLQWDEKTMNLKFILSDELSAQTAKQRLETLSLPNTRLNIIAQGNEVILNGFFE